MQQGVARERPGDQRPAWQQHITPTTSRAPADPSASPAAPGHLQEPAGAPVDQTCPLALLGRSRHGGAGAAADGECRVCFEVRPLPRICAECPEGAGVCAECLRRYFTGAVQDALYAMPMIRCPLCSGRVCTAAWAPFVDPPTSEKYLSNANALLSLRCPDCDETASFFSPGLGKAGPTAHAAGGDLGRARQRAAVLRADLQREELWCDLLSARSAALRRCGRRSSEAAASSCGTGAGADADSRAWAAASRLVDAWQRFEAAQASADDFVAVLHTSWPPGRGANPPRGLRCAARRRVPLCIEDPERRLALQLAWLRRYPKVRTPCCRARVCFKCKVRGWHRHLSCEERQRREAWRDAQFCPNCNVPTTRSDGCNHIRCVCGKEWTWQESEGHDGSDGPESTAHSDAMGSEGTHDDDLNSATGRTRTSIELAALGRGAKGGDGAASSRVLAALVGAPRPRPALAPPRRVARHFGSLGAPGGGLLPGPEDGASERGSGSDEEAVPRAAFCPLGHALEPWGSAAGPMGWSCDGCGERVRLPPAGAAGRLPKRFRCPACDYDLCARCLLRQRGVPGGRERGAGTTVSVLSLLQGGGWTGALQLRFEVVGLELAAVLRMAGPPSGSQGGASGSSDHAAVFSSMSYRNDRDGTQVNSVGPDSCKAWQQGPWNESAVHVHMIFEHFPPLSDCSEIWFRFGPESAGVAEVNLDKWRMLNLERAAATSRFGPAVASTPTDPLPAMDSLGAGHAMAGALHPSGHVAPVSEGIASPPFGSWQEGMPGYPPRGPSSPPPPPGELSRAAEGVQTPTPPWQGDGGAQMPWSHGRAMAVQGHGLRAASATRALGEVEADFPPGPMPTPLPDLSDRLLRPNWLRGNLPWRARAEAPSASQQLPLHLAVRSGNPASAAALLDAGAAPTEGVFKELARLADSGKKRSLEEHLRPYVDASATNLARLPLWVQITFGQECSDIPALSLDVNVSHLALSALRRLPQGPARHAHENALRERLGDEWFEVLSAEAATEELRVELRDAVQRRRSPDEQLAEELLAMGADPHARGRTENDDDEDDDDSTIDRDFGEHSDEESVGDSHDHDCRSLYWCPPVRDRQLSCAELIVLHPSYEGPLVSRLLCCSDSLPSSSTASSASAVAAKARRRGRLLVSAVHSCNAKAAGLLLRSWADGRLPPAAWRALFGVVREAPRRRLEAEFCEFVAARGLDEAEVPLWALIQLGAALERERGASAQDALRDALVSEACSKIEALLAVADAASSADDDENLSPPRATRSGSIPGDVFAALHRCSGTEARGRFEGLLEKCISGKQIKRRLARAATNELLLELRRALNEKRDPDMQLAEQLMRAGANPRLHEAEEDSSEGELDPWLSHGGDDGPPRSSLQLIALNKHAQPAVIERAVAAAIEMRADPNAHHQGERPLGLAVAARNIAAARALLRGGAELTKQAVIPLRRVCNLEQRKAFEELLMSHWKQTLTLQEVGLWAAVQCGFQAVAAKTIADHSVAIDFHVFIALRRCRAPTARSMIEDALRKNLGNAYDHMRAEAAGYELNMHLREAMEEDMDPDEELVAELLEMGADPHARGVEPDSDMGSMSDIPETLGDDTGDSDSHSDSHLS
ncbi:unnamed protein product [Prorocentrum cordatum]|uniref:RING-type domain-containing protein n=1 Tax=Prorocentrum cordatum TaxID=2364126 RepID=A0ABN9Y8C6_9DINO|nr:unnamed protein product [Polarella glacialis]